MSTYIQLSKDNIDSEHICCAFTDKKCSEGYQNKKDWLRRELDNGYVFRRLDERAKVFIEYGPAETAWLPIDAPGYLNLNCFWVSGKYKKQGHGKRLLQYAWEDAIDQGKNGLVTVVGTKKFHFMSDTKWLLRQGFESCQDINSGFSLLVKKAHPKAVPPGFKAHVLSGECPIKEGLVAYYSARCPFAKFHVEESLAQSSRELGIPLKSFYLNSLEKAQAAPSPATIFSLFYKGRFVTNNLSVCIGDRLQKFLSKL
jgi:GNAT superfamily N-acetyltransferase